MKTKLIKSIMSSLLFACALVSLVAAMAQGTSTTARAAADATLAARTRCRARICSDHGWNIVGGAAVPKAIIEGIDFNGDGTLVSPFATVSINGTIIRPAERQESIRSQRTARARSHSREVQALTYSSSRAASSFG